jgi:hypothetical protein
MNDFVLSAQLLCTKRRKDSNAEPLKFSLKHACLSIFLTWQHKAHRHHLRCCCHRQPPDQGPDHHYYRFCPRMGIVDVSGDGRGRVDYSRNSYIFGAGSPLLTHLLFIGVAEDDDLVIARRP